MKKTLSLILAILLMAALAAGCSGGSGASATPTPDAVTMAPTAEQTAPPTQEQTPTEAPVTIRIGGMTGPTSMGMAELMEKNENGESANSYEFTVAGSADELTPKLIQGQLDMAAVPANLAAVLYNNTDGAVKLLAVNTLGVLYIVQTGDQVGSIADLAGKTVYATGKGSVPEYVLRYLLEQNGIDPDKDLTIEWKSEPTEAVAMLSQQGGIAMLPQPYVTVAQGQVEGLKVALDLTREWNALDNGSTIVTGVIAVRSDFAAAHPEQVASFLEEYEASTKYVNENVADAAQLMEKFGIFKAAVAEKAIPYCNITFISGEDMRRTVTGYLQVLFDQNPKSIGGAMPGDDFVYAG